MVNGARVIWVELSGGMGRCISVNGILSDGMSIDNLIAEQLP